MAMCVQCAFDASKAVASTGGAAGATGLLAAASAMLGFRKLGGWLTTRDLRIVTPKRLKIATPLVVWTALLAFYGVRF
jgi:hypothetical protein